MHDHALLLTADDEIGRNDLLRAVEIEAVFRCLLVVPLVLSRSCIEREDGRGEQVVTPAGRANLCGPRGAVASADAASKRDDFTTTLSPRFVDDHDIGGHLDEA